MKIKKILNSIITTFILMFSLSGCVFKAFEEEINVVFVNEGKVVANDTVTQFKNIKTPALEAGYIPDDYRFLGWTPYADNQLDYSSPENFKAQYIGNGRMVHYKDVKEFVDNRTVVLNALIVHKDDIPKDYHYVVVAYYDKPSTTSMDIETLNILFDNTKAYLKENGVSDEDLATIVFRAYSGNVGPTTGQILYDDDVDVMLGWGSKSNITTTGSIPEDTIYESNPFTFTIDGTSKTRYVHRITDTEAAKLVTTYLSSEAATSLFNK